MILTTIVDADKVQARRRRLVFRVGNFKGIEFHSAIIEGLGQASSCRLKSNILRYSLRSTTLIGHDQTRLTPEQVTKWKAEVEHRIEKRKVAIIQLRDK